VFGTKRIVVIAELRGASNKTDPRFRSDERSVVSQVIPGRFSILNAPSELSGYFDETLRFITVSFCHYHHPFRLRASVAWQRCATAALTARRSAAGWSARWQWTGWAATILNRCH
jgi:hypothetical protein